MSTTGAVDGENIPPPTKTPPITAYERSLLLQLIEERKEAIENRKTDFVTYTKKNAAWGEVVGLSNSDGETVKRTQAQLKKIWDNRKQNAKKTVTNYKKSIRKTGGGSGPQTLPPEVERISAMIPEQLHSLPNPFDSDAALDMHLNENPPVVVVPEGSRREEVLENDGVPEQDIHINNSDEDSPPIKKVRKSRDPRSMLVEYEQEEHLQRMKNLRLQQDILMLELRIKTRMLEMMEEEHEKKMNL